MGRTRIVIRRAIDCGRGRAPFLIGLAALIFIPLGLLDAFESTAGVINTDTLSDSELLAAIAGTALHIASSLLGEVLFAGAVAIAVIEAPPGEDPSLAAIIRRTRWGTLIAIDLLFVGGLVFSVLLLVIPAFFFFARYVLAAVLAEIEELRDTLGVPVETYDERLTTVTAERLLGDAEVRGVERRAVIDKVAAAVILQNWLDAAANAAASEERL